MKRFLLITICIPLFIVSLLSQKGGVTIGDSNDTNDGTIRYKSSTGFEGLHLGNWLPFAGTNTGTSLWQTNGSSVYYNANGNVGIGTQNPATKLHISGLENNGTVASLKISSGTQNLLIDGNEIDTDASIGLYLNNNNNYPVSLANGGGNVGIGNIVPVFKLDVSGSVATGSRMEIGQNETGDRNAYIDLHTSDTEPDFNARIRKYPGENGAFIIRNRGTSNFILTNEGTGDMNFSTNNLNRMSIRNNGNVGIGTLAPSARLHVNGAFRSNTVNIDSQNSSTEGGEVILKGAGSNNPYHIDNFAGDLRFFHSGAVAMQIYDNYKITVGPVASTPGNFRMYVATGILTERVKIATMNSADWADYVFDEDYNLQSLNDIKQFIRLNKHLPNIPSATEIEKSGYELQQMDAKLLEKIEVLYLLTIQLNEEKQNIEATNKELAAENHLLKITQQDILERLSTLEKIN